jgi:hypothetical protein
LEDAIIAVKVRDEWYVAFEVHPEDEWYYDEGAPDRDGRPHMVS